MPEIYSDDERRERYEQGLADLAAARLDGFLSRRPAEFAAPGQLRPDLADWTTRFRSGDASARNLALIGSVGGGKTWSLWKIGETLHRSGWLGRYEILPAWKLKRIFTPPIDYAVLDRLAGADLLALDDVAAVRVSDWDSDNLYGLIDQRWSERRTNLLASNNTDLGEVFGHRAASRLSAGLQLVTFDGPDLRS